MFQSFHLIGGRTVAANTELGMLSTHSRAERRERAVRAAEVAGIAHRLDHLPSELSGGERQRGSIARAVALEPAVLLADEPTGNLDSATSASILDLFDSLVVAGTAVLMVTHDDAVAGRAARQVSIVDGRLG